MATMAKDESAAALRARIETLEAVCAEAYQLAGAIGAPVKALDNLSAAANGDAIPHESFLPIASEDCDEVADLLKALRGHPGRRNALAAAMGRVGGARRSPAKRAAARANGTKGGRPRKADK